MRNCKIRIQLQGLVEMSQCFRLMASCLKLKSQIIMSSKILRTQLQSNPPGHQKKTKQEKINSKTNSKEQSQDDRKTRQNKTIITQNNPITRQDNPNSITRQDKTRQSIGLRTYSLGEILRACPALSIARRVRFVFDDCWDRKRGDVAKYSPLPRGSLAMPSQNTPPLLSLITRGIQLHACCD
jgi:hypothetical protein